MPSVQLKPVLILLVLLFAFPASASNLTVSPSEVNLSLNAGETREVPLDLRWDGDEPVDVRMNATLEAENTDTEGVNVSFTPSTLQMDSEATVMMVLETSYYLVSDTFHLEVEPVYSSEETVQSSQTSASSTGGSGGGGGSGSGGGSLAGTTTEPPVENQGSQEKSDDDKMRNNESGVEEENVSESGNVSTDDPVNQTVSEESESFEIAVLGMFSESKSVFIWAFVFLAVSFYIVVRRGIWDRFLEKLDR